jgi:hypothetical protein
VSVTGVEALQPHRIKAVNMTRKMAKNFKRGYGISISFNPSDICPETRNNLAFSGTPDYNTVSEADKTLSR